MRVISGVARGTKLKTVSGTELVRPTTDKVKGAIFNMIQFSVPGAKVLDLFCGSGALGIEALSRGAESVTFVDLSPKSLGVTEENLLHTHLMEKAELKKRDWERFFKQNTKQYSLVLADPPYAMDVLFKLLDCCAELIVPGGTLVFECDRQQEAILHPSFSLYRQNCYGSTAVFVYRRGE